METMIANTKRDAPSASRSGKVRKEFWLNKALLKRAQKALGAASEREAVEMALELVSFSQELGGGARALRGLKLSRMD